MLGYLNAPSPFTADGWFVTQDCVEERGEYFRILGRQSDIINVGGFGDQVFGLIADVAANRFKQDHWVQEIDRMQL